MSLKIDSLVTDLIFEAGDPLDPEVLVEILGGADALADKELIDPDMRDPRFEMQLSPSRPFRGREERRLLIIDSSVAPMRPDSSNPLIPLDLRDARDHLIEVCSKTATRLGRLFALGSWGDAVWVARSYRDLRGVCLISWALDPNVDIDGRRRATPLAQHEFEEKILSYEPRLDELNEEQIRQRLFDNHNNIEERDDGLIVVDMLEEDGTWDVAKSVAVEVALAATDLFSRFVGAKSRAQPKPEPEAGATPEPEAAPAPAKEVVPLTTTEVEGGKLVLLFPLERFSLDVVTAIGRKDWNTVLDASDPIDGATKDKLYANGAEFIAPIEFFSEVFVDGKPLSKGQFESESQVTDSVRSMEVRYPRFGTVLLMTRKDGRRFISSKLSGTERIVTSL